MFGKRSAWYTAARRDKTGKFCPAAQQVPAWEFKHFSEAGRESDKPAPSFHLITWIHQMSLILHCTELILIENAEMMEIGNN